MDNSNFEFNSIQFNHSCLIMESAELSETCMYYFLQSQINKITTNKDFILFYFIIIRRYTSHFVFEV